MKTHRIARVILFGLFVVLGSRTVSAARFTSQELFRIPFNADREGLGARVEGDQFSFPREFTVDHLGRFYIYDSKKHRIARYSPVGRYELGFNYPATARRVFAHADDRANLWLLVSDPERGLYYGVYDPQGKRLREGIFSQYNEFRLHMDDDYGLHVIVSSLGKPGPSQMFYFDEATQLMKKESVAPPPQDHHQVRKSDKVYYIDAVPAGSKDSAPRLNRVTDAEHRPVAQIEGAVIYMTAEGEIYTRVGDCEIYIYDVRGALKGKAKLTGMPSSCQAIRFESNGDIYQLDGIPDANGRYTPEMSGMRMILWKRH